MSKTEKLKLGNESVRVSVDQSDLKKIKQDDLIKMLFVVHLVRQFETCLLDLQEKGLVHGPVHTSIGQEAISAALAVLLKSRDWVGSTHRAHGHFLSKAVLHYAPDGFDPVKDAIDENAQTAINKTLAEIMGLKMGWCGGRGGSMHLFDAESGNLGSNAIVGGGIPLATGAALAEKMKKEQSLVVSIFGDGAFNQGCFHEVANMASLWDLPLLYLVENNGYAVATNIHESSCCDQLALRSLGYSFDTTVLDGMDPVSMYVGLEKIFSGIRETPCPHLCEAMTYRYTHHAGALPGSRFGYRNEEEEKRWEAKDPVIQYAKQLIEAGIVTEEIDQAIRKNVLDSVELARSYCTEQSGETLVIPAAHWPDPETITENIRADQRLPSDIEYIEQEQVSDLKSSTYVDAIASVTNRRLEKDERVLLLGEEVGHFQGGVYNASKGAARKYPDRVLDTPISEAGFVGIGGGASSVGMRPIVEIMFPDFALVAADQMFNQIGKLRHMYGGQVSFPLVLRTRVALGQGYGGQHSMNPSGFFSMFSGWRVMAPSTPFDYVGMFNTAMDFEDPVVIIEHADLYAMEGVIPTKDLDYYVPYGKAKVRREGKDLTVLTYSITVFETLKAADALAEKGIEIEVIDLRTLDYTGMDYEAIRSSVKKTSKVLIVEQNPRSLGISARLADEIQERCFSDLKIPVSRLTSADVPPPVSKALEESMMVRSDEIAKNIERVVGLQVVNRSSEQPVAPATAVSASPLAKKLAEKTGVDIGAVQGSGPRGKIYSRDVAAVEKKPVSVSAAETATDDKPGSFQRFSTMRRTISERMSSSKFSAPHVYFFADVNMDKVMAFKESIVSQLDPETRLSVNDILIKLTALTLKKFPHLNATVEEGGIRIWDRVNVGLAVALEDGLIVPAVPDADILRFQEIANVRKELVDKARNGKLVPEEMSRGTFTISSLAKSNITHFTAIINPPQSAILSVGPARERVYVENGEIKTGNISTLGLSVDHRIIDGKMAADFLSELVDFLENAANKLIAYC